MDVYRHGVDGQFAIRGREQEVIDYYGGIWPVPMKNPRLANKINGISPYNPLGIAFDLYNRASFMPYKGRVDDFLNLEFK